MQNVKYRLLLLSRDYQVVWATMYSHNQNMSNRNSNSMSFSNNNANKNRKRNIIWFNPPFSMNVKSNIKKNFLQLIDKHFPRSSKLHKIFNRNTVKVSYSCTPNFQKIIKGHNKQSRSRKEQKTADCNCRRKQ